MTVYIDIVFLENLFMNYIILRASGIILKHQIKMTRLIIASIIGSIYVILEYIFKINIFLNCIMKIFISIVIIYIAFNSKKIKSFMNDMIIFYLTSFAFGGASFAILFFLNSNNVYYLNGKFIEIYPINASIVGGTVGFIVIIIAFKIVKIKLNKEDLYCLLELKLNDKTTDINAIIDSGNFLKDPISKCSVIIVEKEELRRIIPWNILDNIYNIIHGNVSNLGEFQTKIKIIPFNSVGKQHGILLGVKGDLMEIRYKNKNIIITDFIIGIYDGTFSKTGKYHALVGLDLFDNGKDR